MHPQKKRTSRLERETVPLSTAKSEPDSRLMDSPIRCRFKYDSESLLIDRTVKNVDYLSKTVDQLHPYRASVSPSGSGIYQQVSVPCELR
ncbi:hypothetical protein TNCV_3179011 [Trichonephila clavipes]|nr:hypothetical protein TNCV_3179011 [Trichonephila clavipes]